MGYVNNSNTTLNFYSFTLLFNNRDYKLKNKNQDIHVYCTNKPQRKIGTIIEIKGKIKLV